MKTLQLLLLAFSILIVTACGSEELPYLMTVNGPMSPDEAGRVLSHEHLLVDFVGAEKTGYHRWSRDSVAERVLPFLEELKKHNIQTFIECTPAYLGRDPLLWKRISEESGMNLITNTGYYGARANMFIPESLLALSPDKLAENWIGEFREGIEGTGIKPGFIKIAVDRDSVLSQEHKKLITAAAITHLETGLTIVSHTGPEGPAFKQLDILARMDVHPSAFIWVHAQHGSMEALIRAARSGAWISLDNVNAARDEAGQTRFSTTWYADRIAQIKEENLLHRVLISHDAGWYSPGQENGGSFRGYTDLFTHLVPALKERGFTDQDLDQLLVSNPAAAYSIQIRRLSQDQSAYIAYIEQWQKDRLEGLKAKNGWLNLAGIFWLDEGVQTLGSDPANDIVFPARAPAFMGSLRLEGEKAHLQVNEGVEIWHENEAVKELELEAERSGKPSYLTHGDFAWYLMKRHTSLAIRLRDYKNPAIAALDHIPSFPVDQEYVVEAQLESFDQVKTITVNTPFQDYTQNYKSPGELHFSLNGQKLKLLPFSSGDNYFIIIADQTSGTETYGGGRFMYATSGPTGKVILDFNRAYNPPCAITEFAACPLPPPENYLPVRIEAGEKALSGHH